MTPDDSLRVFRNGQADEGGVGVEALVVQVQVRGRDVGADE